MSNYYKRSTTPVHRSNRVVESNDKKIKKRYKFLIAFAVAFIAGALAMLGGDYTVALVPAILGIVLLFGSVEKKPNYISYVLPLIIVLPIACGVFTGSAITQILINIAMLGVGLILAINYRPFLWKRSVLLCDLPLWYFILFGAVTNDITGTVLLVSILLKTLMATVITLGVVLAVRVLVTGEEIHKWTEQS